MSQKPKSLVKLKQDLDGLGQVIGRLDLLVAAMMRIVGVEKVRSEADILKAEIIKKAKSQQKRKVK